MANINWQTPICRVAQVNPGDLIPIWSQNNGDTRKLSLAQLSEWLLSYFASPEFATQLITPSTGFNAAVSYNGSNVWLVIQPVSTLATGTVTLPLSTSTADGTEVLVSSTQTITTLTVSGNGATAVFGAPTTIGPTTPFTLRFLTQTNSWYKVG